MGVGEDSIPKARPKAAVFLTTHWSVVVSAAQRDTTHAMSALEHLCGIYWYPLYAYVRRRGYSSHDAQDLTQAFFARLLERRWVENADQTKGRFRTFLLTAMSRFLSDEWDKLRAQKRGGGVTHIPVQIGDAETRFGLEPKDVSTPEQCYERQWALTLLDQVLNQLQKEYETEGKAELFAALNHTLQGRSESQPYAELANQLDMSVSAVKVSVHRMRKKYRQLLRNNIAQTVAAPEDLEEELRHLFAVLSGA
jgi:RNA polymerase sigma factor (sigma-70 family)